MGPAAGEGWPAVQLAPEQRRLAPLPGAAAPFASRGSECHFLGVPALLCCCPQENAPRVCGQAASAEQSGGKRRQAERGTCAGDAAGHTPPAPAAPLPM